MNREQATDAVRQLLTVHSHERATLFDPIADAMLPWTAEGALRRMEVRPATVAANEHPLRGLALRAQTNFLPLVLDTFSQSMKVDNYFSGTDPAQSGPVQGSAWQWWQRNRMGARQTGVHRAALQYGTAYVSVLPSMAPAGAPRDGGVLIRGVSPRRMVTLYGEPLAWSPSSGAPVDDDWPILALEISNRALRLYDEENVYFFGAQQVPEDPVSWRDRAFLTPANLQLLEVRPHGVGACPVVRFRDRMLLDGEEQRGIIAPLISIQKRVDETTFEMLVAQYFAAFKQRYILGWLPKSQDEALRQVASDTWFFDSDKVKVGQFDETDLTRYIDSKKSAVRDMSAIGQVPAQNLGVDGISNISAEGLAALETAKERKASEIRTCLGESWEQVLRTSSHIAGDTAGAADFDSEVKWEDETARSFAQTVDGLGKLASMLDIPPQALWEDIPGWSREKVQRVEALRAAQPADPGVDG